MVDPLTELERSAHMGKVRGKGNLSTELRVESALMESNISGWVKHPKEIRGKPDFYFPNHRLALFVDGCFWHDCLKCNRNIPRTRSDFWRNKINENRRRDNRNRRYLWRHNFHVVRVWEHDLKQDTWLKRLRTMLCKIEKTAGENSGVV